MDDDPPPQEPAAPVPSRQARWWRRFGWTFAAVWLCFLAEPARAAAGNPDRAAGALAVVALAAFAVVYLRPWLAPDRQDGPFGFAEPQPTGTAVRALLALGALAALTVPGAGPSGLVTLVFVCTYAIFALPLRWSAPLSMTLLAATAAVGWAVPGWSDLQGVAEGGFLAGVAVFGISRMALRGGQLALAQQDLARLAVAEERSRMARDLHDLLGHSLTVVTLKAELAGRLLEVGDGGSRGRAALEVADIERLARDALSDVRAALEGHREVSLGSELAGARQALAAAGIDADLPGAVDDVPGEVRELFGWVVREGVTNVLRHSGARRCWVELSAGSVSVSDDGRGSAPSSPAASAGSCTPGSGLRGLADRAAAAGGSLRTTRSGAGGFSLRVSVPVPSQSPLTRTVALREATWSSSVARPGAR